MHAFLLLAVLLLFVVAEGKRFPAKSVAFARPAPVGVEVVKEIPDDFPQREDVVEAIKAVRKACAVTMKLQPLGGKEGEISTVSKQCSSPVTVGDFAAQAVALDHLSRAFPSDRFIAEESSSHLTADPQLLEEVLAASSEHIESKEHLCAAIDLGQSYDEGGNIGEGQTERIWTLDPIDGTKGFLRGKLDGGQYCVALAKLTNGKPVIGILGCPNLPSMVDDPNYKWADGENEDNNRKTRGCIFVASKGGGCFQLPLFPDRDIPISKLFVTPNDESTRKVTDARFCCGVESGFGDYLGQQARIAEILHGSGALNKNGEIVNARRMDSQAKHGVLARSEAEIFVRLPKPGYQEWIWDSAAGFVVITEAGGKLTDIDGNELDFSLGAKLPTSVRGMAMSNGGIFHDRLLQAFQEQEGDLKEHLRSS